MIKLKQKCKRPIPVESFLEIANFGLPLATDVPYKTFQLESFIFVFISYERDSYDYYVVLKEGERLYLINSIDVFPFSTDKFIEQCEKIDTDHNNNQYLFKKEISLEFI